MGAKRKPGSRPGDPGGKPAGKKGVRPRSAPGTGARSVSTRPEAGIVRVAGVSVAAALATWFVLGWIRPVPVVVSSLVVGVGVGLLFRRVALAASVGGGAAFLGGLMAAGSYTVEHYVQAVQKMPPYTNPDVLFGLVYQDFLLRLIQSGPFASAGNDAARSSLAVLGVAVLTAAVAGGTAAALRRETESTRSAAAYVVIALLGLTFAYTCLSIPQSFMQSISVEPTDGQYAVDHIIYMRTYLLMSKGTGYYPALVQAAAGDKRLIESKDVRDGKFYGWDTSPTLVRQPWVFWLWRLLAPGRAVGVFRVSVLLVAAWLVGVYWAFSKWVSHSAIFLAVSLVPVMMLAGVWHNIFMPDWWASLAVLAGVLLVVRGHWEAAGALALAAALFREVAIFWLLALLVASVVRALRGKSVRESPSWRTSAVLFGLLLLFALAYGIHYVAAGRIIAAGAEHQGFIQRLRNGASRDFAGRFLSPASYMMFGYGQYSFPTAVLLLSGAGGFVLALRRRAVRLAGLLAGYVSFWAVWTAVLGATSSYWGQEYMPLAVIGTSLLVLSPVADERDPQLASD